MRDLLFLSVFSPLTLLSLVHPWSGVLAFGWILFLKPHGLLLTFASQIPVQLVIAASTALGFAFSKKKKAVEIDPITILLVALVAVAALSTVFSLAPAVSKLAFIELTKTMVFLLMLRLMIVSRIRLHSYIWLMAFAMAFIALHDGVNMIISSGGPQLVGALPPDIIERHDMAMAMMLSLPLMNYLRLQSSHHWMAMTLIGAMAMTATTVLVTFPLGGFIGLWIMAAFIWWRSNPHRLALAASLVIAIGLIALTPDQAEGPMGTVEPMTNEDSLVKQRIYAWHAYTLAALSNPLTGAGLDALKDDGVIVSYALEQAPIRAADAPTRAAQSVYFQVAGDLGFLGLLVYLALLAAGFWQARAIISMTRRHSGSDWMADLAQMIQASLIMFSLLGAVLSVAFYDYFLSLLIILSAVHQLAKVKGGERVRRTDDRSGEAPVDTTAIASIWQKAADTKVTRLRGHRSNGQLVSK